MNVTKHASDDIAIGGGINPPCTGLIPDALPEVQMPLMAEKALSGVSTRNILPGTNFTVGKHKSKTIPHWYVLRTTYGREKKACNYMRDKGITVYHPTLLTVKIINGKRKTVEESRIPNIFFAYGTEEEIKSFVYDNINLPYLRFYYKHIYNGSNKEKEPLIVPDNQIESLKIICNNESEDIIVVPNEIPKFKKGQLVTIIDGHFKGVTGRVARFHGQQRVAVFIDGLMTIVTAYVPSAFLKNNAI
ncbi:MAG: UpxY family transcription antiterminator [Prevotellaceae bacterium]|nr:UpxY family transcription antiterminator [Prevotellaceae bacterium]